MSTQVLIVAPDAAAKAPAEVAVSLSFTPVVTASEQEALDLLGSQTFSVIAVSSGEGSGFATKRSGSSRRRACSSCLSRTATTARCGG